MNPVPFALQASPWDLEVPVLNGDPRRYVQLDHAASAPALPEVVEAVNAFLPYYANVHRGHGYAARVSSWALDEARDTVRRFLGAEWGTVILFARNATEALNHAAARWPLGPESIVIATGMEHHSNDLPWRRVARVEHARVDAATGHVDEDHLHALLEQHKGRVRMLTVTAASNVTGIVNPIYRWARWAHEAGARIVVDAAQLVAHRPLAMKAATDPEHLDAVAFSGHKMYAPFGCGVLAAPRDVMGEGEPRLVGGGTVDAVSLDHATWTHLPDREEAGTPVVVGAVALMAAIKSLETMGWDAIERHEADLLRHGLEKLRKVPGLKLYAAPKPRENRLGLFSFNLRKLPHGLVSAILDYEWAIGTRSGCFCAHPYVKSLLDYPDEKFAAVERRIASGDRTGVPGLVRASVGIKTTLDDIDRLADALSAIAADRYDPDYRQAPATGAWTPAGAPVPDFDAIFG